MNLNKEEIKPEIQNSTNNNQEGNINNKNQTTETEMTENKVQTNINSNKEKIQPNIQNSTNNTPDDQQCAVRIAVVGNVDSGKSTLVGV